MMIDTKVQEPPSVPPPAYPVTQSSAPQPQFVPQMQWQPPVQQPIAPSQQWPGPQPTHAIGAAEAGEAYRASQFAQCAQGNHQRETKYGVCGIITAVLLFPIGLICLFMDTEDVCRRCGNKL